MDSIDSIYCSLFNGSVIAKETHYSKEKGSVLFDPIISATIVHIKYSLWVQADRLVAPASK